jgi:hypothetical protein
MPVKDIAIIFLPMVTSFVAHYVSANVYANMCVPFTIRGLIQSIALTGSPVCSTVLTVMNQTQNIYGGVVVGLGAYWLKRAFDKEPSTA